MFLCCHGDQQGKAEETERKKSIKDLQHLESKNKLPTFTVEEVCIQTSETVKYDNLKKVSPPADSRSSYKSIGTIVVNALKITFLPVCYPDSVREEYLEYQLWDSLQGLCSYLRSVLTTRAMLTGAGVGNADASIFLATLAWMMKDGLGMLGSLMFAFIFADVFEVNVKEWRLTADILCNVALTLDMCVTLFPDLFLLLTSMSSVCKAVCGLVAGATKVRISAHFALRGQLADVTAKESTQETAVTLVGLIVGLGCARVIGDDYWTNWIVFIFLLFVHQYANYRLVKVLILNTLNPQKIYLIVRYIHSNGPDRPKSSLNSESEKYASESTVNKAITLPTPLQISREESILRPFYLSLYGPRHGVSISLLFDAVSSAYGSNERAAGLWSQLRRAWRNENFIIGLDKQLRPLVCLQQNCSEGSSTKALFIAFFLQRRWQTRLGDYFSSYEVTASHWEGFFDQLVKIDAADSLVWYEGVISEPGLEKFGWDIEDGKARLGAGSWRYTLTKEKCS